MFSPDSVRSSERFTRAAPSTCGREKSKFLSAKVKSCCSEGESPSGLAECRRNLERKNLMERSNQPPKPECCLQRGQEPESRGMPAPNDLRETYTERGQPVDWSRAAACHRPVRARPTAEPRHFSHIAWPFGPCQLPTPSGLSQNCQKNAAIILLTTLALPGTRGPR
jgi:hypothetical protein